MKHTKWFILAAGLALLTACSNDPGNAASENTETTEETSSETESAAEQKEKEEKAKEEEQAKEEAKAKEEAEKEALLKPDYRVNPETSVVEPIADANAEAVLITIDDAPDKHAVEMAETLKQLEVPAIFFVNGHFLDTDEEKENLKKIHEMGFAIGNHTYSHTNLKTISDEEQREEIISLSETVEQIIGEKPKFFRAPNGSNTDFSKELVKEEGMVLMNWTYGYDWEPQYQDADALTDIMVNSEYLNKGGNLLMHDREWTAKALPEIIEGLSSKGYSFIDPQKIEGGQ